MRALAFWKAVTVDHANMLEDFVALLNQRGIRFCVIDGQGVNAYAEPLVSLDLDIVVAADQLGELERLLPGNYALETFPHSLNLSRAGSDLRIPIQTDPRYAAFVHDASMQAVLGLELPVATIENVLQGTVWAAQDPRRRSSKRQKDLAASRDCWNVIPSFAPTYQPTS